MNKNIYIIRHGESESNAGLKSTTAGATTLTEKGRVQAETAANNYTKEIPQLIVTSSYIRTKQTAEPFIKLFPSTKIETWDIHEFAYLNPDLYNNSTMHERKPAVEEYWTKSDPFLKHNKAESFFDFMMRVEKFTLDIRQRKEKNILVFSHCYFMNGIRLISKIDSRLDELSHTEMKEYMKMFLELKESYEIKNAQIFELSELI